MRSHLLERIEDPAVRHPANYAFPSGEGGPHVRVVDEEDIIAHSTLRNPKLLKSIQVIFIKSNQGVKS